MNLCEFLQDLVIEGWKFWNEDNRLRYRAPNEESSFSKLAQLKQYKVEILQLLQERPDIFEIYPISYGQRALWFLWQLAPEIHAYNVSFPARICSAVDITAIKNAFEVLIERHPILRTNYLKRGTEPIQQVHQNQKLDFLQIDASTCSEGELKEKVIEAHQQHFDLEREPVMRVRWFTCSEKEHILLVTIHHIACDRWSLDILLQELPKLYEAQLTGVEIPLPPLKHSYQDYVGWQREILSETQGEKLWGYWQYQLNGDLPILNLPTDKQRGSIQTYNGASIHFKLSDKLTEQLRELARTEGVTLYMMLLAAFEVLLYRYTGQEDILVGSPTSGRSQPEFALIFGYFINPVVIRANLSHNPSFKDFLRQARQTVLEALTYQDYPFALLVEKLQPHRDSGRSPIFQAFFALQQLQKSQDILLLLENETQNIDWGLIKLRPFEIPQQEGQFDLDLEMVEGYSSLKGIFNYNTDLFDESTIKRMAGHFQNLLSAIVENPHQAVAELPLLSEAERHQLLMECNDTATEYPQDKCIHQLFEQQVKQTPDAVAVVFDKEQLTYQQLNQKANQLAHHLQSLEVGPEVLVGICVERSVEMIVGLLGILKAGGVYVPLDSNYPQNRLSYMLADSGLEVLLTQKSLLKYLPQNQARVVCLDTDWETIEQQSRDNLDVGVSYDNLAYVIYTSGSTGEPKGVAVCHQAVNRLVVNTNYINLQPTDVVAFASNFSFDAATFEIWGTLLHGAKLVGIPKSIILSPKHFANFIQEQKISTLFLTTALFNQIANIVPSAFHSVQNLMFGGEAVDIRLVEEVLKNRPPQRLLHVYGPTESTTFATWYLVKDIPPQATTIPIGRPIANTQIYILDSDLQPVPIGVSGELYIGGDGLARSYLNRPELTKEKFILNPFLNSFAERLYKTGDLARYSHDGNITFIGRIDNQVKVRGFRIELGEIETLLNTHPQVQQAVVVTTEDIVGSKRLVAYVVTSDKSFITNQIREFLKLKLPEYMVPSAFVILDTLPLTPNGKIDKSALPAPDGEITREHEYVAPRTPRQETIANIFADVLDVQNVGIHDNFFELGGHSLLANQLISQLREALEVEIPIRAIFESPTIAQLEQTLTSSITTRSQSSLPPIQPRKVETEQLPLSWAQERLWFLDQLEGASPTYNMPGAIRISGKLDINALQQALSEIARRHEVLRTSFPIKEGTPIQLIHSQASVSMNLVDLQQLLDTERETLLSQQIQQEAITPFDLEKVPLIRCSLLQLNTTEYVFLLTMHHIISDAWSIGIFIQELSTLYQAFSREKPSPLPELPIQYADFAVWQRQWLSGEVLQKQLDYWLFQLAGVPELLQLPTDRPRPAVQTYKGKTLNFTLNTDLTQQVKTLCRKSDTTLFMTLEAVFATLLYRYSGQSDILIGSPIANRQRSETDSLIGFFLNTLVLRTRFEENPSFESLLAQVKETTLKAYEHQDVPFEQIVAALRPERSLSYSPLYQAWFVLHNTPIPTLELPGLTTISLNSNMEISTCDLLLSVTQKETGLECFWEYNTDLFDETTIVKMTRHFQNLLEGIIANPQTKVRELSLLKQSGKQQLSKKSLGKLKQIKRNPIKVEKS